mgnify:CR=1 FL=1
MNQLISKSTNQQIFKLEIGLLEIGNWFITTERSLC